jgi:hypothetical protein
MTTIGSVLQTGVNGITRGIRSADQAASDIAHVGVDSGNDNATIDIADAAVNLKLSEIQVKASAKVVKAADDMLGTILDITA